MKTSLIGNTGISCSRVGLGTWAFASQIYGEVPESDSIATIHYALDSGISLFDTAPLYGTKTEDGVSETILGRGLGNHRKDVVISSKFGRYSSDGAGPNFNAKRARESVEGSLRRLNTDYLDILFFHSPFGPDEIHDDVWDELGKLKSEGKIRVIGHSISMFEQTEQMARDWISERKIELIQVVYSLMNRQSTALLEFANSKGAATFARESLANGFLTESITRDTVFGSKNINKRYPPEEIAERVAYVEQLGFLVRDDIDNIAQAAVRWVLDNPNVTSVLAGAKNVTELADWVAGGQAQPFSKSELQRAREAHSRDFQAA